MVIELGFFVLFMLLAIGAPLVLYGFIRKETSDQQTMDRSDAERAAQKESRRRRQ
ncbi:hypothetical protein GL213_13030 [Halogeometricum borinquense]|uniref:hypothetical protein n=1 Tax=Halogeometricum borinquense TaxID=60847 RepID=UPI001425EAA2|nr:hypothetical protein [Halogeometricum borinquense]QIQ77369.1 hypothetical protein GL213_13030 [Halogeometricum borinquense]